MLHAKRWYLYVNEKENIVKGGYSVEVVGHDKKKVIWEVVEDHVVQDPSDHEEIGLREFDFNIFNEYEEGFLKEGSSEFPYLLILIKLWTGDWIKQLKMMNKKVDDGNGKALNKGNVRYRKVRRFSGNEFWKNIGCLVSAPTFGLGGSRLWEKEEEIKLSGKKRKRLSIQIKVDFYEVCISYIIYCLLFYFKNILTPFTPPTIFQVSLSLEERSYESIGHKDLSRKRTRQQMNCGGKSC